MHALLESTVKYRWVIICSSFSKSRAGSFDQVEGSVQLPSSDQSFADYKVVLYIHITSPFFYGWVVKPGTDTAKVTNIQSDGTFSVQYATGGTYIGPVGWGSCRLGEGRAFLEKKRSM